MDSINAINSTHFSATYNNHQIDFLITGVGMVATTYHTAKMLLNKDRLLHFRAIKYYKV